MDIKPEYLKKVQTYRNLLFFVNLPLLAGIPLALECGLLDTVLPEKVDKTYMFLMFSDFFFTFNSILIYTTLKTITKCIKYDPVGNKLEITQFSSPFLGEKTKTVDPKELINCKRKTFNPLVGYRSLINNNEKYATESLGVWHDRRLMESLIYRENRPRRSTKSKEDVEKLWGDKKK